MALYLSSDKSLRSWVFAIPRRHRSPAPIYLQWCSGPGQEAVCPHSGFPSASPPPWRPRAGGQGRGCARRLRTWHRAPRALAGARQEECSCWHLRSGSFLWMFLRASQTACSQTSPLSSNALLPQAVGGSWTGLIRSWGTAVWAALETESDSL